VRAAIQQMTGCCFLSYNRISAIKRKREALVAIGVVPRIIFVPVVYSAVFILGG